MKNTGTLLFHRKYHSSTESDTDIMLQSGLITALYSFAKQVVKDEMEHLQMKKVTMLFNHQNGYIFVLFLDSGINPSFCEQQFKTLQQCFFDAYPETLWNKEIVNTSLFSNFKKQADKVLLPLDKKLELYDLLLREELVKEKEILRSDLEDLGRLIAGRLLERHHNYLLEVKKHNLETLIHEIDSFLEFLGQKKIKRNAMEYQLACNDCLLCKKSQPCFYEEFLHTIADQLDLTVQCSRSTAHQSTKRIKI